ncbi:GNAT family N-acetyltransferase [Ignatzschineria sp. LJL83]
MMSKIAENSFVNASNEAFSFVLKKLEAVAEKETAGKVVYAGLEQSNALAGKTLYTNSEAEEIAFLSEVSELYGIFESENESELIAVLAVEEDSIERIAVIKEKQHRGIGSALLYFAHEVLNAEYADVYADNVPALRFFEHCGLSMFDETEPEAGDLMAESPHKVIHLMY